MTLMTSQAPWSDPGLSLPEMKHLKIQYPSLKTVRSHILPNGNSGIVTISMLGVKSPTDDTTVKYDLIIDFRRFPVSPPSAYVRHPSDPDIRHVNIGEGTRLLSRRAEICWVCVGGNSPSNSRVCQGQKIPVGNVHPATSVHAQEPEPDGLREAHIMNAPFSIRVHAASVVIPICPTLQALDVYTTDMGQTISIYRISQDSRILIDRAAPIEIWSRWLPVCWGSPQPIEGKGVMPEHDSITWSASPLQDSNSIRVTLNPGSGAPPVDFLSEGSHGNNHNRAPDNHTPITTERVPGTQNRTYPTPVVTHNNRFHQVVSGGRGD